MPSNIRIARKKSGKSQKEVAITLKVSSPTVSDWESGKTRPTAENLKKLATLFGVSADYLLGQDGKTLGAQYVAADWGQRFNDAMVLTNIGAATLSPVVGLSERTIGRIQANDLELPDEEKAILAVTLGVTKNSLNRLDGSIDFTDERGMSQILRAYMQSEMRIKKAVLALLGIDPEEFILPVKKDHYDIEEDIAREEAGLPPYDEMED